MIGYQSSLQASPHTWLVEDQHVTKLRSSMSKWAHICRSMSKFVSRGSTLPVAPACGADVVAIGICLVAHCCCGSNCWIRIGGPAGIFAAEPHLMDVPRSFVFNICCGLIQQHGKSMVQHFRVCHSDSSWIYAQQKDKYEPGHLRHVVADSASPVATRLKVGADAFVGLAPRQPGSIVTSFRNCPCICCCIHQPLGPCHLG